MQATLQAAGGDQMKHLPSWNKATLLKIHTHPLVSGQPRDKTLMRSSSTPALLVDTKVLIYQLKFATRQHWAWLQTNRWNPRYFLAAVRVRSCRRLPLAAKGNPVGTLIWFLAGCDMRKWPVGWQKSILQTSSTGVICPLTDL